MRVSTDLLLFHVEMNVVVSDGLVEQAVLHCVTETCFNQVCKPAYLVPVPIQDKLGGLCKEGHPA